MDTASPLILNKMTPDGSKPASQILIEWHEKLQEERGWRAELRRADTAQAALMCSGFRDLSRHFRDWLGDTEWHWLGLAIAASVAAHVRHIDTRASFAAQLGKPPHGSNRPPLSRLRFTRLNDARDEDDFYRQLTRAVHQLDNTVNLPSLVDGILLWCREQDELNRRIPIERSPFQRPALRWATEYFQATEMIEEQ